MIPITTALASAHTMVLVTVPTLATLVMRELACELPAARTRSLHLALNIASVLLLSAFACVTVLRLLALAA